MYGVVLFCILRSMGVTVKNYFRVIEERLAEEQADEPAAVAQDKQNDKNTAEEEEEEDDTAMPVPQVKVGPDGQIVLDEKSLV
jgi:transcription factor TFIIIB component B''